MPRIDPLHELIRSLTTSEKRYFKLFAKMQGGEKNYLRLFDAIDRMEEWDTGTIRREFEGEAFTRQLSVAKNYLRNLVMKSLRLYHSGGSTLTRLHEAMIDVEILTDKGLRSQAGKIAQKAAETARKYGRFQIELEAVVREHGLDDSTFSTPEGIERAVVEQQDALDRLENILAFGDLTYHAVYLVNRSASHSGEWQAELDRLMESPLLSSVDHALSPRAVMRYHWLHAAVCYCRDEIEQSLHHCLALIEQIESDPTFLPDFISFYTTSVSNALLMFERLGDTEGLARTLDKLAVRARESVRRMKRGSREEAMIVTLLYTHQIALYRQRGDLEEATALVPEIERALRRHSAVFDAGPRSRLLYQIASLCATTGDFERALRFNNRIVLEAEPETHRENYRWGRLLDLLIHFELGNDRLLASLIPSAQRYFRRRGVYDGLVRHVVELIRGLRRQTQSGKQLELLGTFCEQIELLRTDPASRNELQFFDYAAWAEGRRDRLEKLSAT